MTSCNTRMAGTLDAVRLSPSVSADREGGGQPGREACDIGDAPSRSALVAGARG